MKHYPGSPTNNVLTERYVKLFKTEEPEIIEKVKNEFTSNRPDIVYLPRYAVFLQRVRDERFYRKTYERQRIESESCGVCKGEIFSKTTAGEYVPCKDCNPEAYKRWQSGHYESLHVCAECEDMKGGPTNSFDIALLPKTKSGRPVSPTRTKQWIKHLSEEGHEGRTPDECPGCGFLDPGEDSEESFETSSEMIPTGG